MKWQELKAGQVIAPGAVVQTAKGAYVDLVFHPRASLSDPRGAGLFSERNVRYDTLRVLEDSILKVEKMAKANGEKSKSEIEEMQFGLRMGRVFGVIKMIGDRSQCEVLIPNGLCGVHEATFMVSADQIVAVLEGAAYVYGTNTQGKVEVSKGFVLDMPANNMVPMAHTISCSPGSPRAFVRREELPVIAQRPLRKFF